jgi:hypothetical protein
MEAIMAAIIKFRRGQTSDRFNIIPEEGEIILDIAEKNLYVGDGVTPGGILIKNGSPLVDKEIRAYCHTSGGARPKYTFKVDDLEDLI